MRSWLLYFTFNFSNAAAAPSNIFSVPKIPKHCEMASANTVPATKWRMISKLLTLLMNYRIDFDDQTIESKMRDESCEAPFTNMD